MREAYAGDEGNDTGWQGVLHRLFGSVSDVAIGLLALLFAILVFGFVLKDAIAGLGKDRSGVRTIIASRWNDRTLVFPVEGADRFGRTAMFDIVVLRKSYGWATGSTSELERDGMRLSSVDIEREVLTPQLREGLASANRLIAVGLASQEGEIERETQRAGARAARIAEWVRGAVGPSIPLYTLNLGRYLEICADCENDETSWQRPFIVVAVRSAESDVNISEALAVALSDKKNLPSPSRYSAFALAKYQR